MIDVIPSASAVRKSCGISAEHQAKQCCLTVSFLCSAVGDLCRVKEKTALTGSHPPAQGSPCCAAGKVLAAGNTLNRDCAASWSVTHVQTPSQSQPTTSLNIASSPNFCKHQKCNTVKTARSSSALVLGASTLLTCSSGLKANLQYQEDPP